VGPTTTSLFGSRSTAVHKTHPQENGSSPFPSACASSSSLPSHRRSHDHTPKQFLAFDTLHELQPMAFCRQFVSLNICTCSQAAYGTFHAVGCQMNALSMTTDAAHSDRLIASAYVSSRMTCPAMLHRFHQRAIHRVLVHPRITCVHCPRSK
jgi:hypothetical protein